MKLSGLIVPYQFYHPPPCQIFSSWSRVEFFTSKCIYRSSGVVWNTFWTHLTTFGYLQKSSKENSLWVSKLKMRRYDGGGVFDIFTLKPKRAKMHFARFLSKLWFQKCSKTIRRGRKPLYTFFRSFWALLTPSGVIFLTHFRFDKNLTRRRGCYLVETP